MGSNKGKTARNPEAQGVIGHALNGDQSEKDTIWGNDRMWAETDRNMLFSQEPICQLSDEGAADVLSHVCV